MRDDRTAREGGDGIRETLAGFCRRTGREELLSQWHPDKNLPLTPDTVSSGSSRRVWWRCEQGHEWKTAVYTRTASMTKCPYCVGKLPIVGKTDFASQIPALAKQWHPTRNGALTPQDVTAGTHRKVWWMCEKGHEWQAAVFSRAANGAGCPVCAGKVIVPGENDLRTIYPGIAREWHAAKNENLTPETVSPYSNRKVWWICERGHAYQAVVAARTIHGSGCPYCAGRKALRGFNDLATVDPKTAEQWHPILNGNLTPEMVTAGSRKKVWWVCSEGHVWKAAVYSRTGSRKSGCPVCAGRVKQNRYISAAHVANSGASRV